MSEIGNLRGVARNIVIEFLRRTLPFNELEKKALEDLASGAMIGFYPKGTLILKQDSTEVRNLYLIQKGGVRVFVSGEDTVHHLVDFLGEASYFGALNLISGAKANLSVETVEDTFCFLLDKRPFLSLIAANSKFAQQCFQPLTEDAVGSAYSELRCRKLQARTEEAFYLFSAKVGDVINRAPEIIPASASIHDAASRMASLDIGFLLVSDPSGAIVGIVTDKDLRNKVVARRLDFDQTLDAIMTAPLMSISADSRCFDAVLQMMKQQVHHLAVTRENEIAGVVTSHDILVFEGSSPLYLMREIDAQRRIEGLYGLSQKVPNVIRSLIEGGAKANNITRVISVLNDHILERLLSLMQEELGPAPVPFAWITMGSEGRKEQTFWTDQDNALVYEDPGDTWDDLKAAKLYFRHFGNQAVEHLVACGYPLCKSGMMASRAKWRKPFSTWKGYFDLWMSTREQSQILHAKIFFDFRRGYGDEALTQRLRDHVTRQAEKSKFFLNHLSKDSMVNQPPLSFFRNFIVEKDGEHKNRLDLKLRGLVPIVDFARAMALRYGIKETNTAGRLRLLNQAGHLPKDLFSEVMEAYEFLMQLRLVHQLRMLESDEQPHSFLNPSELSDLEKKTLKEAFRIIESMQTYMSKSKLL